MGTSVSSPGPSSSVQLVPPWVSGPDTATDPEGDDPTSPANGKEANRGENDNTSSQEEQSSPTAPPYRFRGTNVHLKRFARSGSGLSMVRGLRQYVRTGLGGTHWASRRMAGTSRRASALYGALSALSRGEASVAELGIDTASLAGRPARDILDRIVETLSPSDGTLDSEASRNSIFNALSRLIREDPTADLIALTAEQIDVAIELFIGEEICRCIELNVGKTILANAASPAAAIDRLREISRFVGQAVRRSFRNLVTNSRQLTQRSVDSLVSQVIQNVFRIFGL